MSKPAHGNFIKAMPARNPANGQFKPSTTLPVAVTGVISENGGPDALITPAQPDGLKVLQTVS